jgi:glycosyltransferase involved in cell wall biosynthesis
MQVIVIGTDRKVFDNNSPVARRFTDLSKYTSSFTALGLTHNKSDGITKISNNTIIQPVYNPNKIFGIINLALSLVKRLSSVRNKKEVIVSVQEPFFIGLVSLVITKIYKVKFHSQVHIDFFSKYYKNESFRQFTESLIAPFVLRRSDGVRVVSQKIKSYLVLNLGIHSDKISFIPVTVNSDSVINSPITESLKNKYPEFSQIILLVSRLVKQKNIPLAIEAFKKLLENNHGLGIVIVVDGPERSHIENIIKSERLGDCVILEKWSGNVPSLMKTADIFMLTSNYEGWGMTAIEALACGLPVIMSNVGCAGEIVRNGYNGMVFEVGDLDTLVKHSAELLSNSSLREELIKHGIETVKGMHKHEETIKLIVEDWSSVLNNK